MESKLSNQRNLTVAVEGIPIVNALCRVDYKNRLTWWNLLRHVLGQVLLHWVNTCILKLKWSLKKMPDEDEVSRDVCLQMCLQRCMQMFAAILAYLWFASVNLFYFYHRNPNPKSLL